MGLNFLDVAKNWVLEPTTISVPSKAYDIGLPPIEMTPPGAMVFPSTKKSPAGLLVYVDSPKVKSAAGAPPKR